MSAVHEYNMIREIQVLLIQVKSKLRLETKNNKFVLCNVPLGEAIISFDNTLSLYNYLMGYVKGYEDNDE